MNPWLAFALGAGAVFVLSRNGGPLAPAQAAPPNPSLQTLTTDLQNLGSQANQTLRNLSQRPG